MEQMIFTPKTAILAIMSSAAYNAHSKGDVEGANPRERVERYLVSAVERFPGLAKEIEKYDLSLYNQNMISLVNDTDRKVIIAFRGTILKEASDILQDIFIGLHLDDCAAAFANMFNLPNRYL